MHPHIKRDGKKMVLEKYFTAANTQKINLEIREVIPSLTRIRPLAISAISPMWFLFELSTFVSDTSPTRETALDRRLLILVLTLYMQDVSPTDLFLTFLGLLFVVFVCIGCFFLCLAMTVFFHLSY